MILCLNVVSKLCFYIKLPLFWISEVINMFLLSPISYYIIILSFILITVFHYIDLLC